jgi:hypothetical protein
MREEKFCKKKENKEHKEASSSLQYTSDFLISENLEGFRGELRVRKTIRVQLKL